MNLRKLEERDAEWMLEWMHEESIVKNLFNNFSEKGMDDCISFIHISLTDTNNVNLAIVDDTDTYMGTVSLKHIDNRIKSAEFAITVRKIAMGKGYAIFGMNKIFELAKKELKLETIYWCVSRENLRAIKFYNKHGFKICSDIPSYYIQFYSQHILKDLIWYFIQL